MKAESILFTVKAGELLESGQYLPALELCRSAVIAFPDYPAGLLMLSTALIKNGESSEAEDLLEHSIKKFPKYKPLQILRDNLRLAQMELVEIESAPLPDESIVLNDEPAVEPISITFEAPEKNETDNFLRLVTQIEYEDSDNYSLRADNPALIAGLAFTPLRATKKISSTDFSRNTVTFPEFYNPYIETDSSTATESLIEGNMDGYASETLATILESQGAHRQALEIYQQLIRTQPERSEFFESKIKNIQTKIIDNP